MSAAPARMSFIELVQQGAFSESRHEVELLAKIDAEVERWRSVSAFFPAGFLMSRAIHAAWGSERTMDYAHAAIRDFGEAVARAGVDSWEGIAALKSLIVEVGMNYVDADPSSVGSITRELREELAHRLVRIGQTSEHPEALLVRGFRLATTLDADWEPLVGDDEVDEGVIQWDATRYYLSIPSAFRSFVSIGDYIAADEVAAAHSDAFTTPGLRGWRSAVRGLVRPGEAIERFDEAADHFAKDVLTDNPPGGHWSGINVQLWSKYFRARARVAEIVRNPARALELLTAAGEALEGTAAGWTSPQATCLRVLVGALHGILIDEPSEAASQAREEMNRHGRSLGVDTNDRLTVEFLDSASRAFEELRDEPEMALVSGKLSDALRALGRIPLFGSEVANAITPAIGKKALSMSQGQVKTWIHRALGDIKDERLFQHLLLRLSQGGLPEYAQVRHGPLEYGKDVVVLVEQDRKAVLLMYQAKIGNLTKRNWPKTQSQLEEMFQVDLAPLQLPRTPDDRIGILVLTGHVDPHVEPNLTGWLAEQRQDHHRTFEVMHLDAIVRWIVDERLINEFRAAISDLRIGKQDERDESEPEECSGL